MKRKLLFLLALIALVLALAPAAAWAQGGSYAFTAQPKSTTLPVGVDTASAGTITWETNFTPVRLLIYHRTGGNIMPWAEPAPGTVTYAFPSSATPYYIEAYYTETDCVQSGDFLVTTTKEAFTQQPEFKPETLAWENACTLYWDTNFSPTSVEVFRNVADEYSMAELVDTLAGSVKNYTIAGEGSGITYYYWLRAHYGDGQSVDSSSARIAHLYGERTVTATPESASLSYGGSLKLRWERNFLPTRIEIKSLDTSTPGDPVVEATLTPSAAEYTIQSDDSRIGKTYNYMVYAYYELNGTERFVYSAPIPIYYLEPSPVYAFTAQPTGGQADISDTRAVSWVLNFIPHVIEVRTFGSQADVTPTHVVQTLRGTTTKTVLPEMPWPYYLYAFKPDGVDYVVSEPFRISKFEGAFTTEPHVTKDIPGANVTWATSFTPSRLEITDNSSFWRELDDPAVTSYALMPGTYRLTACFENEVNGERHIYSESFTNQPKSGCHAEGSSYTVPFSLNFTPEQVVCYAVDAEGHSLSGPVPFHCVLSETADKMTATITLDEGVESAYIRVAATYNGSQQLWSDTFRVSRPAFTTQPADRYRYHLDDDLTSCFRLNWETSFTPVHVKIESTDGTDLRYTPDPTATEYELAYPYAEPFIRSFRILAWYGEGENEYVESSPFTLCIPHIESFDRDILIGEDGAEIHFAFNFVPDKVEIYRIPDDGTLRDGYPNAAFTLVDTIYPNTAEGTYPVSPADLQDGDYCYRVIGYYSDDITNGQLGTALKIRVHMDGVQVRFALGEGGRDSFNVWTAEFTPMEPVRAAKGDYTVPACRVLPPDYKMFDHWAVSGGGTCRPGDVITLTDDITLVPVWTDRVYTWIGDRYGYDIPDTVPYSDTAVQFYVSSMIDPYIPSDMVKYDLSESGTMTVKEQPNLRVIWYQKSGDGWTVYDDGLPYIAHMDSAWGKAIYQCVGPYEVGQYRVAVTYFGDEVLSKEFEITEAEQYGSHHYELNDSLSKTYDGNPVFFDPYKSLSIDGGKTDWGMLEKYGEARYLWQQGFTKGDTVYYNDLDSAPTEAGSYRLVIQELGKKDWSDAAYFPFTIGSVITIEGDVTDWESKPMTLNPITGLYEYSVELSPEMSWSSTFEYHFSINGGTYIAAMPVIDAIENLPLRVQGYDDGNSLLMVSDEATFMIGVDPDTLTVTVTNDRNLHGAFLMGFMGDYPQRMVDPLGDERPGGEGDMNKPIDPYIFSGGTTLWATGMIGGTWLEDNPSFYVGSHDGGWGPESVTMNRVLSLTSGQKTPITNWLGGESHTYDFYFCPETHEMVIQKHRFPHPVKLYTWDADKERPMTVTDEDIYYDNDNELGAIGPAEVLHEYNDETVVYDDDTIVVTPPQLSGYRANRWSPYSVTPSWDPEGNIRYELNDGYEAKEIYALSEDNLFYTVTGMEDLMVPIHLTFQYVPGISRHTVTFDTQGGTPVEAQTIDGSGPASAPQTPIKIGAVFLDWYTQAACTEGSEYSFDVPVTADITLYAGWLTPEPNGMLRLPAMLKELEAEAFSGIAAEAVVIPKTVTAINGNPFAGSAVRYVYGYPGTVAETLANAFGYLFVTIDDAWMSAH